MGSPAVSVKIREEYGSRAITAFEIIGVSLSHLTAPELGVCAAVSNQLKPLAQRTAESRVRALRPDTVENWLPALNDISIG